MTIDRIGVIADDFTGATDIAGLLARSLEDVHLHSALPGPGALEQAQVHVVALKIRTEPAADAIAGALAALNRLIEAGATRIYWKYCSTFDSTDRGNIGPVAEALMSALGQKYTLYCPAFPENGRVVRGGHLYVNGIPLSESAMRDHPLTPMRQSDLTKVLSPQVAGQVAYLSAGSGDMRRRAEVAARAGEAHLIIDAETDADLAAIAMAFSDLPLLTGGSAFAAAVYGKPQKTSIVRAPVPESVTGGPALILSGSCSAATRQQVARFRRSRNPVVEIDPILLDSAVENTLIERVIGLLGAMPVLLTSTTDPENLGRIQSKLGTLAASKRIEGAMARIAAAARRGGATRFIVTGGETSGAVTQGLDARRLVVRNEIAPGVPWCITQDGAGCFALALKSGNFGGPNFFQDALAML